MPFALLAACSLPALTSVTPPRLTVVISIDQFRADYTERFAKYYLPAKSPQGVGGFQFLKQNGAVYVDARHDHVPTATGPGHATLLTGSEPALDGIVGNEWYDPAGVDWSAGKAYKPTYC